MHVLKARTAGALLCRGLRGKTRSAYREFSWVYVAGRGGGEGVVGCLSRGFAGLRGVS